MRYFIVFYKFTERHYGTEIENNIILESVTFPSVYSIKEILIKNFMSEKDCYLPEIEEYLTHSTKLEDFFELIIKNIFEFKNRDDCLSFNSDSICSLEGK